MNDKKYVEPIIDLGMDKWKIESELKKYSFEFVEEFRKIFSKEEYTLSVRRNIMTGYNIKIKSYEQFWCDWNKFKKLKEFI